MAQPNPPETTDSRALDAAAMWRARLSSDRVTDEERRAFQAWLSEAPGHMEAWAAAEQAWGLWDRADGHPSITAMRAQALRPRMDRRAWMGGALAAGFGGAVLLAGGQYLISGKAAAPTAASAFSTPTGQVRHLTLADGTVVTLDADSAIRVAFDRRVRNVELLRGRAQFAVAHDKAHPFVVTAQGRTVTALGTRFDVERQPGAVAVTLIEGRVAVREVGAGQGRQATLAPGERLTASDQGPWLRRQVDVAQLSGWSDGRLVFADEPLGAVAAEMNRYSPRKLRLADDGVAAIQVSGVFQAGDPEALAAGLEASGVARVLTRGRDEILLGAP